MITYDIIIIGAGAAGMMAAISSAREGMKVLVLEKMERPGRKILITGKGRCNITNTREWEEFSRHIFPKPNFFKFAFKSFSNFNLLRFLNEIGLETVIERGERAYPLSGKSQDVVKTLAKEMVRLGVEISYNSIATKLLIKDSIVTGLLYEKNGALHEVFSKAIIISTGGLSYPLTGSDGDGYIFAENLGIKTMKRLPSLTALMPSNYNISLKGLILKNISVKLIAGKDLLQEEFGDAEFTNNGFEGPVGLRVSRKAVKAISEGNRVIIDIDLKPALSRDQLISRIEREFGQQEKVYLESLLRRLLPGQLVNIFIDYIGFGKTKILSKKLPGEIYKISDLLKSWKFEIISYTGFERCVVTTGGVSLDEILPKTLASRKINNLYFAGEVIDLDGDTGGYNLQIAFSTGYVAGKSAAEKVKKSLI